MPLHYHFENLKDYLLVTTSGSDVKLKEALSYSKDIVETAIKFKCKNILCDERNLKYTLSTADTYKLAEWAAQYSTKGVRVGLVCDPRYLKENRFYETVASNRGLMVHATEDFQSVLDWFNIPLKQCS